MHFILRQGNFCLSEPTFEVTGGPSQAAEVAPVCRSCLTLSKLQEEQPFLNGGEVLFRGFLTAGSPTRLQRFGWGFLIINVCFGFVSFFFFNVGVFF